MADWIQQCPKVEESDSVSADTLTDYLSSRSEPVVLRGLVKNWPVVRAAQSDADQENEQDGEQGNGEGGGQDGEEYLRYLAKFAGKKALSSKEPLSSKDHITVYRAPPEAQGRIFYNEDFSGFNFQVANKPLSEVLLLLSGNKENADDQQATYYVGSTLLQRFLPGFLDENSLPIAVENPLISLWLGNRSRIAAHYDFPDNLACCIAGKRRFILFPPDQIANLYVGPLDLTPSGQAISLVDFYQPDFQQFPRFAEAMKHAVVAELEPGDALFIPSMWWHHVDSLSAINGLVNYWWRSTPAYLGNPTDALTHALMSIKGLPKAQKQAWKELFDYYIFNDDESSASEHIPEPVRGVLQERLSEQQAISLRQRLLQKLNR
ncbi:cupin-like domain-containing protein [Paraneptunicella aestuarii]|uniref:cupin-like domain-containing protein n=1 Tax=Paraneptunicella aestuarii TaxID=2831148 RepID=UPI001E3D5702|nr:cupin-like domain-containing protein [Paraneptunicella aestuarii]UAA37701.1 cupin-like domain-containing protein [Paraneptunicella aestuarii]